MPALHHRHPISSLETGLVDGLAHMIQQRDQEVFSAVQEIERLASFAYPGVDRL